MSEQTPGPGVKPHLETILGVCLNQMSSVYCLRITSEKKKSLNDMKTFDHLVFIHKSKELYFEMQFDPGRTAGLQRPVPVK